MYMYVLPTAHTLLFLCSVFRHLCIPCQCQVKKALTDQPVIKEKLLNFSHMRLIIKLSGRNTSGNEEN